MHYFSPDDFSYDRERWLRVTMFSIRSESRLAWGCFVHLVLGLNIIMQFSSFMRGKVQYLWRRDHTPSTSLRRLCGRLRFFTEITVYDDLIPLRLFGIQAFVDETAIYKAMRLARLWGNESAPRMIQQAVLLVEPRRFRFQIFEGGPVKWMTMLGWLRSHQWAISDLWSAVIRPLVRPHWGHFLELQALALLNSHQSSLKTSETAYLSRLQVLIPASLNK